MKTNKKKNSLKGKKKRKKYVFSNTRIWFVQVMLVISLIALFCVTGYIKLIKGETYETDSINLKTQNNDMSIASKRGTILNRSGQVLAMSTKVYNVILDARVLMDDTIKEETRNYSIEKVAEVLEIEKSEIEKYIVKNEDGVYSQYKVLAKKVDREISDILSAEIDDGKIKGFWLETDYKRIYPSGTLAANVVGFTSNDGVGQWGLENEYNDELIGTDGRSFVTYENGTSIQRNVIEAKEGDTIVTTIDPVIQQYAEIAIENAVAEQQPENAAIIVANPNTMEIYAMASSPGFDLNNPQDLGVDTSEMSSEEIVEKKYKMWRNYNISDTYEPGSTFKPIVMAMALEEEIISLDDTFKCTGKKVVAGQTIKCWKKEGHGIQTLEEILSNSCNVGMMEIAELMGSEIMYKYHKSFGFGQKTGIDLPGEASAATLQHQLEEINQVELATMSFGQTFNCTPIQLITAFSAVINGGNLMKPYVVSQIIDSDNKVVLKNEPQIERKVISKETSDIIRVYLQKTLEEGTGRKAKIDGYAIGGKTGTAEQGARSDEERDYVITFVAYLPVENPQIIALALLDRPVNGDETSASPMLKELLENTIKYLSIEPTEESTGEITTDVILEDFTGLKLVDAATTISLANLNYKVYGTGNTIINQVPKAGEKLSQGSTVMLYMTKSDEGIEVVVPDVIGKTYEEAMETFSSVGIVMNVEGAQEGLVYNQEPKAGITIEAGGSVKVKFK